MTATAPHDTSDADLTAGEVAWDLSPLLGDAADASELMDQAEVIAQELLGFRGRLGALTSREMAAFMGRLADLHEVTGRAHSITSLEFATDTSDPVRAAAMQAVNERSSAMWAGLVFIDVEWAAADDTHVTTVLGDESLAPYRHHLEQLRRYRPHLLSEDQETVLAETSVAASTAWVRLFEEQTASVAVTLDEGQAPVALMSALSRLAHPDRDVRAATATAVTEALAPGLRTRAYIYNTLLLDKSIDDRLRSYPTWVSRRNLSNEASDASVEALVRAVVARYDLPQRWYAAKAQVLGVERLADYDRMASVGAGEQRVGWREATEIVRDAYGSFSGELADVVGRFLDEGWIDAPVRPGKRGGAFCAYTVPSHHPYVLLNWTASHRDVSTLAHELGHGVHGYLAREQGVFHQSTPLTLAETASVFGETVTTQRLLDLLEDPAERFSLLAASLEDSIATVFRQVAMFRFEQQCHTERRTVGELSVDRFGELWAATQTDMLGDAVEVTEGYRSWWSYIPHFIATPGYVYAYAYGQLLALSVYAQYQRRGASFVPAYLDLLRAGGSSSPEELASIVGCDLTDPSFWDAGLRIVEQQLDDALAAARQAGRL
jgi:oligoendopeptidase F